MRRKLGWLILVSGWAACSNAATESTERSVPMSKCGVDITSPSPTEVLPECEDACTEMEQVVLANCPERCSVAVQNAAGMEGPACADAVLRQFACDVAAPGDPLDCMDEALEKDEVCSFSHWTPGQWVCYSQCEAVACSCIEYEDLSPIYADYTDCIVQCWTNLGIDLAAGCLEEAVLSRQCFAEIEYCDDYLSHYYPEIESSKTSCETLAAKHAETCEF